MSTQELYSYIDQRLDELSREEQECLNKCDYPEASRCISKKCELLDFKTFIQEESK